MPVEMVLSGSLLWHDRNDVYPIGAGLKAIGWEGIAPGGTAVVTICPGKTYELEPLEVCVNE